MLEGADEVQGPSRPKTSPPNWPAGQGPEGREEAFRGSFEENERAMASDEVHRAAGGQRAVPELT
jgi:hypothetical protein